MKYYDIKRKKIIIFGASIAGEKFYKICTQFDIQVECFVDNDPKKDNTLFNGKFVKNPELLNYIDKDDYFVVISSMYIKEIRLQLESYGLQNHKSFCNSYEFNKLIIDNNLELLKNNINYKINYLKLKKEKMNFAFGLERGLVLGGAEIWAESLSDKLNVEFNNSYLMDLKPQNTSFDKKSKLIFPDKLIQLDINLNNYFESIISLCKIMVEMAPVCIVPNYSQEMVLSSYILIKLYPEIFNSIYILQGDTYIFFEQARVFNEVFKKFICASKEIKSKLEIVLQDRKDDIEVKISPVSVMKEQRTYSKKCKIINLGFASRLVKQAKRADLLIDLINQLEKLNIKYNLNIAGEGEYYNIISNYIRDKKLESAVKLYGLIEHSDMKKFWREQDIFLSLSDYEGTSISMLEALSNGVVPIVTNVSGVNEFISNGYNGFIVNTKDVKQVCKYVEKLYYDRQNIKIYGERCRNIIKSKCDFEEYVSYFYNLGSKV